MCVFSYARKSRFFRSCDLDLDPMTLTYELGLGILKTYLQTKNEISMSELSKVRAPTGQTHRQTDRQLNTQIDRCDRKYYHPHWRVVI